MNRLFLRVFLLMVLASIGASTTTYSFLTLQASPAENAALETMLAPGLARLRQQLQDGVPPAEVFRGARLEVGNTLALVDADLLDLSEAEQTRLDRGEVVIRGTGLNRMAYVGLPDDPRVLEMLLVSIRTLHQQWAALPGTPGEPVTAAALGLDALDRQRLAWRPVLARGGLVRSVDGELMIVRNIPRLMDARMLGAGLSLLFLALGVGWSLWPVRRDLIALSQGASRLRDGDLDARVQISGPGPVAEVALQFNSMADRVRDLIESHEELLRSVSHEMQTPAARLMFAVDALAEEPDQPLILEGVRTTVDEMRVLAEELLQFNRLGRGQEHLVVRETLDLAELAEDVVTAHPGSELEAPGPLWVEGDPRLLYRALKNLVENAIAYGTPPVVRVQALDGQVVLHVDDGGRGIPEADRERVFEPFVRVEGSRARKTGGTGLGLAIVRRVAERHGGSCAISSSPEGGARITLRLPEVVISRGG